MEAERAAFVCNDLLGTKLSRTQNEGKENYRIMVKFHPHANGMLNAHVQYICTHTTVRFLQKRSLFMPEGKVFDYKRTD